MMLMNSLFESKNLSDFLKTCNEIYAKDGVDSLVDFFTGSTPTLREVSNAAIEYCNAGNLPLDDNVYLLTAPNGKQYAGQTTRWEKRLNSYKYGDGSNKHWTSALRLYTIDKFKIEHYAVPTACADIIEKFMILWYDLMNCDKGYNKRSGGKNGWMMSVETRAKISAAHLGKKLSVAHKSALCASWTLERKRIFGVSQSGEKHPNFKKKLPFVSESNRKRVGEKRSEASRANISAAKLGKKLSVTHKASLSAAWTPGRKKAFGASQSGDKSYNAQSVVVNGTLYSTAKEASTKQYGNIWYVKNFIRRHNNSTEIFKVSKEFYKYCNDNEIKYIKYEMFKEFEQYIMPY
jgi:hypothetical protein